MIGGGQGYGRGSDDGAGSGSGDNYGYGFGCEDGSGHSFSYGDGRGHGYGCGDGYGYGDSMGSGSGDGSGSGYSGRGVYGVKIGVVGIFDAIAILPWGLIKIGCYTKTRSEWEREWKEVAKRHRIRISRATVAQLLAKVPQEE